MSKIRIEAVTEGIGTKVYVDDVQQNEIFGVEYRHFVKERATVKLHTFLTERSTIHGEATVEKIVVCPKCRIDQMREQVEYETPSSPGEVKLRNEEYTSQGWKEIRDQIEALGWQQAIFSVPQAQTILYRLALVIADAAGSNYQRTYALAQAVARISYLIQQAGQ